VVTKKICDKCKSEVKQFDSECSKCGGTSFSFLNDDSYESKSSEIYINDTPVDFSRTTYGEDSSFKASNRSNNSHSSSETTLADLVRAQDRTTHAVRAFVRFLFIQLSAITIAVFFWNIGAQLSNNYECTSYRNCGSSEFFFVAAGITWLAGLIWSSIAGWDELHKSDL
jgi:hypothetical protein